MLKARSVQWLGIITLWVGIGNYYYNSFSTVGGFTCVFILISFLHAVQSKFDLLQMHCGMNLNQPLLL